MTDRIGPALAESEKKRVTKTLGASNPRLAYHFLFGSKARAKGRPARQRRNLKLGRHKPRREGKHTRGVRMRSGKEYIFHFTQTPPWTRVSRRRAANKRARASRKANRRG